MAQFLKTILKPVREFLGDFALKRDHYTHNDGCINASSSFLAWNLVEGDYLEFGVFTGGSFSKAYHAFERNRIDVGRYMRPSAPLTAWTKQRPRFFAFDSFEGLPGGEAVRAADYDEGAFACSQADFLRNVRANGVDMNRVITVPGMYDQSLTADLKKQHGLRRAAMIFIDCDLYESTVPVLDFITDLVDQGTIIIFQDWFRFKGDPRLGEQRACNEWLQKNPQLELIEHWREGAQAVSFLVNMKKP